jgi:hypothetical protein
LFGDAARLCGWNDKDIAEGKPDQMSTLVHELVELKVEGPTILKVQSCSPTRVKIARPEAEYKSYEKKELVTRARFLLYIIDICLDNETYEYSANRESEGAA